MIRSICTFFARPAIYLPLLTGVLFSLASNLFGWDLALANLFYDAQAAQWLGPENRLMEWLYLFGVQPAVVLVGAAIVVTVIGFVIPPLACFRRLGIYFILIMAVGNGLVVNAVLKQGWGRPRPCQLIPFGGTQAFEPSLWYDASSDGHSFPSGHASMGFYFFSLALLLSGRARLAALLFALAFGAIIGLSRITYGGHFLTDVIWAGMVMWLVAQAFHRILRLDNGWRYEEPPPRSKAEASRRLLRRYFAIPLLLVTLTFLLLHVPRNKREQVVFPIDAARMVQIELTDMHGTVKIIRSQDDRIQFDVHGVGFGLPKTRLKLRCEESREPERLSIKARHRVVGYFKDLSATTTLSLPQGARYSISIDPEGIEGVFLNNQLQELPAEKRLTLSME